eukprot:TRINITY_DN351_c0_g1_i1.p1 TRINITY_DN351_c0_g1~~TRINITY_DN351_c0_g1_i1.p1  ORF type:complete len:335 (-),score=84.15 TRINITY_DN351_c0_g1_i1:237-1157(-)
MIKVEKVENKKTFDSSAKMKMVVLHQDALAEGVYSKNGVKKDFCAVVKNHPFKVELGLVDQSEVKSESKFSFSSLIVDVILLYDCGGDEEKAVQFVKSAPVEYSTLEAQDTKDGSKAVIEVTIKVLSSQHEDSFFILKFIVKDQSGKYLPQFTALSQPIRVVSKPNQAVKSKKISGSEEMTVTGSNVKRKAEDSSHITLQKVWEDQQEIKRTLGLLLERTNLLYSLFAQPLPAKPTSKSASASPLPPPGLDSYSSSPFALPNPPEKRMKLIDSNDISDLDNEELFKQVLNSKTDDLLNYFLDNNHS